MKNKIIISTLLLSLSLFAFSQSPSVQRMISTKPIISAQNFADFGVEEDGDNINGPCLIRVPSWIPKHKRANPKAKYYLYFAHHHGQYIRMAWASKITGPWTIYNIDKNTPKSKRGVLGLPSDNEQANIGNNIKLKSHIASPFVQIDKENKQLLMYFHSSVSIGDENKGQVTLIATSEYGLDFNNDIKPVILGPFYFSVFKYQNKNFAFTNKGHLVKCNGDYAWEVPNNFDFSKQSWAKREFALQNHLKQEGKEECLPRHFATFIQGNTLDVFFSLKNDSPEKIWHTQYKLFGTDINTWEPATPLTEVFKATKEWEGANIEPVPGYDGYAKSKLNDVRDPNIFIDNNGKVYLVYCAGGESAIGIAKVYFESYFL